MIIFLVFACFGAFLGFIEGSIPFIPLAISIAVSLGYDSMVGVAAAMLGALAGFCGGPTNPFTVGVSHTLAQLPMFSGIGLRSILALVFCAVTLEHILRYGKKSKRDPSLSYMNGIDTSDLKFDASEYEGKKFTVANATILVVFLASLGLFVYGATKWKWSFGELNAIYVFIAVFCGIVGGLGINRTAQVFVSGAAKMAGGALIIGIARGITWILEQGKVIDTIVYYLSSPLSNMSPYLSVLAMFVVIALLDFVIPSGSGKAMIIMPLIIPLADIIGVSRQTTVLAYQLGDGITNFISPTLGVLLFALAFGKVPYTRWAKFIAPLVLKLFIVCALALIVAVKINYGPF